MASKLRKCEICRDWIDPERLEAVPKTQLCDRHGREIEKYGGEFITASKPDRAGRPGGIKIIEVGVTTELVPNSGAIEKLRRDYEDERYSG